MEEVLRTSVRNGWTNGPGLPNDIIVGKLSYSFHPPCLFTPLIYLTPRVFILLSSISSHPRIVLYPQASLLVSTGVTGVVPSNHLLPPGNINLNPLLFSNNPPSLPYSLPLANNMSTFSVSLCSLCLCVLISVSVCDRPIQPCSMLPF